MQQVIRTVNMEDRVEITKTGLKDGVLKGMRKIKASYPAGFFDFEIGETWGNLAITETKITIKINPQFLLADTEDIQDLISLGMFEEKAPQEIEGKFMLFLKAARDESHVIAYHPYKDGYLNPSDHGLFQRNLADRTNLKDIQKESLAIIKGLLIANSILPENQ